MSPRMSNVTQLVECLISMYETPDSIPRTVCNGGTLTLMRWRQKDQEFGVLSNYIVYSSLIWAAWECMNGCMSK